MWGGSDSLQKDIRPPGPTGSTGKGAQRSLHAHNGPPGSKGRSAKGERSAVRPSASVRLSGLTLPTQPERSASERSSGHEEFYAGSSGGVLPRSRNGRSARILGPVRSHVTPPGRSSCSVPVGRGRPLAQGFGTPPTDGLRSRQARAGSDQRNAHDRVQWLGNSMGFPTDLRTFLTGEGWTGQRLTDKRTVQSVFPRTRSFLRHSISRCCCWFVRSFLSSRPFFRHSSNHPCCQIDVGEVLTP